MDGNLRVYLVRMTRKTDRQTDELRYKLPPFVETIRLHLRFTVTLYLLSLLSRFVYDA